MVLAIDVEHVSKSFGNLHALNDVFLAVDEHTITILMGPNGSGKSTLLKAIAGLTNIFDGSIKLDGEDITGLATHTIAKKGIAYLPQTESIFTQLTVSENFQMAAHTVKKEEFDRGLRSGLEMFPQLSDYLQTKAQNLSEGERQMVAMTMALIRKPKVIMLDEPTANLSPKLATQVLKNIESLAKNLGMAVLLVEQNARKALEIGTQAYLLVGRKKVFDGSANKLLTHEELAQMHLGVKTAEATEK